MEDEYMDTVPVDDTVAVESAIAEYRLFDLDVSAEVADACESASHIGDNFVEEDMENIVVLDSDDEGGGRNAELEEVNGEYVPINERFCGRDVISLCKRQQVPAGYIQRQGYKISWHEARCLDTAESDGCGKENNEDFHPDAVHLNMTGEGVLKHSPGKRKLLLHEPRSTNMLKDRDCDCEVTILNYYRSPEPSEPHDTALDFVDHYLSANGFDLHKDAKIGKCGRVTSPPSLWLKGFQNLAQRISHRCTDIKLKTFDWDVEHAEKNEYKSLKRHEDSVINLASNNDNLIKEKMSSLLPVENFEGKTKSIDDLDPNMCGFTASHKIGSHSGIFTECDLVELNGVNEQFNVGLLKKNAEIFEQLKFTQDSLHIGLDTQMAAEAMEALVHAALPIPDPDSTLLKPSSNADLREGKLSNVAYREVAFIDWKCKAKRSRCVKIPKVQFKNQFWLATSQSEIQKAVAQLPVSREFRTKGQRIMKGSSRNLENRSSRKCRGPHNVTLRQQKCGFDGRNNLKDFEKHHHPCSRLSKEATDVKSDFSLKHKKRIGLCDNADKITGNCLKLNSEYSGMDTGSAKSKGNCNLNVNPWNYPKGKRTRYHSPRSRKQRSPSVAFENKLENYSLGNVEAHKRAERIIVYTRRRRPSISDSCPPPVNANSFSEKQVKIYNVSDAQKTSELLDGEKPPSIEAAGTLKSDGLSNGHYIGLQVFDGNEIKQPSNCFSRSPLMRELVRLGYYESLPQFLPKDSRRRRSMEKVSILLSQNLKMSILKQQRKIVVRLGLSIASCCSDATHFVTDRFVRTRNMLEAIALGKPVVVPLWLECCEQAGYLIDEKNYIVRDANKEKEIGFNMSVSLMLAHQRPLLKGRAVLMTPNVKPGIEVITALVKAVHGQAIESTREVKKEAQAFPDDLLVLSHVEDYPICLPFMEKGTCIYDSELLLNGIITQKLEYKRYRLFEDFTKDGSSALPR